MRTSTPSASWPRRLDAAAASNKRQQVRILQTQSTLPTTSALPSRLQTLYRPLNPGGTAPAAATGTRTPAALRRPPTPPWQRGAEEAVCRDRSCTQTDALIVSAPARVMDDVMHLVDELDKQEVADALEFRIFTLKNTLPTKVLHPRSSRWWRRSSGCARATRSTSRPTSACAP